MQDVGGYDGGAAHPVCLPLPGSSLDDAQQRR